MEAKDVEKLLNDFVKQVMSGQKMPYNFNLLDEQCGHIVENSHTNILMRLLEYKNQHGYVFLENFFNYLGISITIDESVGILFDREKSTKGEQKDGRIDGFISQNKKFALIIENKINHAPTTTGQLQTYIEDLIKNKHFNENQVYVIYLTEAGIEKPQKTDIEFMKTKGICVSDNDDNGEIHGDRYFAVNYRDHILPWLKEEIQPNVIQRDVTLNTGLIQYIDYLEGRFGIRKQDVDIINKSEKWIKEYRDKKLKELDFKQKNEQLASFIAELIKIRKELDLDKEEGKNTNFAAGILINLIEKINEDEMKDFFDLTRKYFEDKELMEECITSHPFSYNYIQIRNKSWPRSVHFEWTPLGIDKLTTRGRKYSLCFHVENKKIQKIVGKNSSFVIISISTDSSILDMDKNKLSNFLENAYSKIKPELVVEINKRFKS